MMSCVVTGFLDFLWHKFFSQCAKDVVVLFVGGGCKYSMEQSSDN
jgi:hypothetical protein